MEKKVKKFIDNSLKIGDFFVSAGASFAPGGSLTYDGIKKLLHIGKDIYDSKIESKIHDFHMALINGEYIDEEYINKEFSKEDYYHLLNSCIQDIEDEKADLYGFFLKQIIRDRNTFTKIKKQRLITILRDLSLYDISILKKLFIYSNYPVTENKDKLNAIYKNDNEDHNFSLKKLENVSLINIEEKKVNKIGQELLSVIFPLKELTPESMGLKEWKNIRVYIILFRLNDKFNREISEKIEVFLYNNKIKSFIATINKNRPFPLIADLGIFITDEKINDEEMELIKDFSNKRPLLILDLNSNNDFSSIKKYKYFNIDTTDLESSLEIFYSTFKEELNKKDIKQSKN